FQFFDVSAGRWHRDRDIWWCILSFDPVVLTHDGVYFTTTNNIYPAVRRGRGEVGLKALFEKVIYARYGARIDRPRDLEPSYPTCEQAEVLYPSDLSTRFLRKVYVAEHDDHDDVCGQLAALRLPALDTVVDPKMFKGMANYDPAWFIMFKR